MKGGAMSGPNDNFDPKQVAALSAEAIDGFVARPGCCGGGRDDR